MTTYRTVVSEFENNGTVRRLDVTERETFCLKQYHISADYTTLGRLDSGPVSRPDKQTPKGATHCWLAQTGLFSGRINVSLVESRICFSRPAHSSTADSYHTYEKALETMSGRYRSLYVQYQGESGFSQFAHRLAQQQYLLF